MYRVKDTQVRCWERGGWLGLVFWGGQCEITRWDHARHVVVAGAPVRGATKVSRDSWYGRMSTLMWEKEGKNSPSLRKGDEERELKYTSVARADWYMFRTRTTAVCVRDPSKKSTTSTAALYHTPLPSPPNFDSPILCFLCCIPRAAAPLRRTSTHHMRSHVR